ncbi:MAG: T9SS type A sorting domain-containing protein [bacterium]
MRVFIVYLILGGLCLLDNSVQAQWVRIDVVPNRSNGPIVYSLASTNGNIYVGSDSGHVFQSSDNGKSWSITQLGIQGARTWALAANDNAVFAASSSDLFISSNCGTEWMRAGFNTSLRTVAFDHGNLFAGTGGGVNDSVIMSTDEGLHWSTLFKGWMIYAFGFCGTNLFAGNFHSIDAGRSWLEYDVPEDIYSFVVLGSRLFAGTYSGVYISDDAGNSWRHSSPGLPRDVSSFTVCGNYIFAGTRANGIYFSSDSGASWSNTNGSTHGILDVYAMTISGERIYAGTSSGLWVRNLSDMITMNVKRQGISGLSISFSPNPTTGIMIVHNAPANLTHVTVTNILGETVSEVANFEAADFSIDLSRLPQGTYFARFSSADEVITRKIIKE